MWTADGTDGGRRTLMTLQTDGGKLFAVLPTVSYTTLL